MREKKKSKWLSFILGMVIYAIVVLLAASVALKLLWDFAAEYEIELPSYKMNEYVSSLNETHVRKISEDFISSLDRNIQSREDAFAVIWKAFVPGVRYRQIATGDGGNTVTYMVYNKDHDLGRVTLVKNGEGLGRKTWSVSEEEYDFSYLKNTERFIVPNHWVVRCGDRRLGVQYIIDPRVEYAFLHELYGKEISMPYLAEYEISNYIGDANVRFFDPNGEEQARFTYTDGREQITRVSGASRNNFINFAENFVPLYVDCLSNVTKSANLNYQRIRSYLVPNGDLDKRLKGATPGQVFSQTYGIDRSDVRVHDIFNLGNEYYIIDLSYSTVSYSENGTTSSETSMYLVVYRDDETILAQRVEYY
ncbi:MAG: hypothetical protein IKD61_05120 [Oscillospiraceae bacterium]|nr:hypothetical protein [Oscillospiraceae bacterium]